MPLWNFPLESLTPVGVRYMPTRILFPAWQTAANQAEGERNYRREIDIRARLIDSRFDLAELRLARSPLFPHLPLALDAEELLPRIKAEVPEDGIEIVEWMQEAAADQAILSARMEEYNRCSRMVIRSGDGYIPGVRVQDVYFGRIRGYDAARVGGTINSPVGRLTIPPGRGGTLIGPDFLAFGAVPPSPKGIQWAAKLIKWLNLAKTPINTSIGFPSFYGGAVISPNFFVQEPNREASRVRVTMRLASDRDQRARLTFRSPANYTREIDIPADVTLSRGTNEIDFIIASYPSVPLAMTQVAPAAGAVLREYRAEAI